MQRYFWLVCATIGYLRDAWAKHLKEDVLGGEFIRSEWKSFTSRSILAIPSRGNGFPLILISMYPPHTRLRSTETWTGATQGSLGRALLPSAASSSLFSSLDVNKCLPPTGSYHLSPRSLGLGKYGIQGFLGCQSATWAISLQTHDNSLLHSSIMPAHLKSPSLASLSLMTCTCTISSTPICSLKWSNQSRWRHLVANAPKYYVSTFAYHTTNVPCPWLVTGYRLQSRQYWGRGTCTML